jgi:hypothetical protein
MIPARRQVRVFLECCRNGSIPAAAADHLLGAPAPVPVLGNLRRLAGVPAAESLTMGRLARSSLLRPVNGRADGPRARPIGWIMRRIRACAH